MTGLIMAAAPASGTACSSARFWAGTAAVMLLRPLRGRDPVTGRLPAEHGPETSTQGPAALPVLSQAPEDLDPAAEAVGSAAVVVASAEEAGAAGLAADADNTDRHSPKRECRFFWKESPD